MGERWIFSFRFYSRRELSDTEREECRRRARQAIRRSLGWAVVSGVFGLGIFFGIILASGGSVYGWPASVACLFLFFWTLHQSGKAGSCSLLFRRAARVGITDIFRRAERSPLVLEGYRQASSDEEAHPTQPASYWQADEKFEERLAREAGSQPDEIQTPVGDDVLIFVGTKMVDRVIEVPMLTV